MTYIETKADPKLLQLLETDKIANSNDEIWKLIVYPHFYVNIFFPMNIIYVSSLGRVMTLNGVVKEYTRPNRGVYVNVQIPRNINETSGSQILLHRIVAYTFLGPPEDLSYTVDHINRNPLDNRAVNLRWASLKMQLENRHIQTYNVQNLLNNNIYSTLVDASKKLGISIGKIKGSLLDKEAGFQNTSKIGNDIIVTITSSKKYNEIVVLNSYKQKQSKPSKRQLECYYHFVTNKMSIEDISKLLCIAEGTVVNYISKQYNKKDRDFFLHKFKLRRENLEEVVELTNQYWSIDDKKKNKNVGLLSYLNVHILRLVTIQMKYLYWFVYVDNYVLNRDFKVRLHLFLLSLIVSR